MFDNLVPVAWIVRARSTIGPFVQWRRLVSETGNCAKKGADNRCGPVVVPPPFWWMTCISVRTPPSVVRVMNDCRKTTNVAGAAACCRRCPNDEFSWIFDTRRFCGFPRRKKKGNVNEWVGVLSSTLREVKSLHSAAYLALSKVLSAKYLT